MDHQRLSAILESIEKITLFLEERGVIVPDCATDIMSREFPDMALKYGPMDIFVLTKSKDADDQSPYAMGWIGNGQIRGNWLEGQDGLIVDPWLDERVRKGFGDQFLEYLPVVVRQRVHTGPLDIIHSEGHVVKPDERFDDIYEEYQKWSATFVRGERSHTRMRYLLEDNGLEPLQERFVWARAALALNQTDLPFKPKASEDHQCNDECDHQEIPVASKNQKMVADAIKDINTPQKLSLVKCVFAAASGLAAGYLAIQFM